MLHGPDRGGLCRLGWVLNVSQSAKRRSTKRFKQGTEMTRFCYNTLVAEWEGEEAEDRKSTYLKYCFKEISEPEMGAGEKIGYNIIQ